jgi:hypothetical protein
LTRAIRAILWISAVLAVLGPNAIGRSAASEIRTVIYPEPGNALRGDYVLKLLELALERSGRKYVPRAAKEAMTQARAARQLEEGSIDFIWAGTSAEYEERFRPVRIPVLRGLEGYRICIIHRNRQAEFSAVASLDELKRLTIGQATGWFDATILQAAGFKVVSAQYENLFTMVERQRFDCFLRGAFEAPGDVAERKLTHPEIAVESDLLLVYPFASFFFVNKNDAALAEAMETGLRTAYDDGAFMRHFDTHPVVKAILAEARIDERRRFDIPNPFMSAESMAIPARYWRSRE